MGEYCNRCGEYYFSASCRCKLVGKIWSPDCGETEDDAADIWSSHDDPEVFLPKWAEVVDGDNAMEAFEYEQTVAFKPIEGDVKYFTISRKFDPVYYITKANEGEAS